MKNYFFPELITVKALEPYKLRTTWSTNEILDIDVEHILKKYIALRPILNPEVFTDVHMGEWGGSIEWFDEEFGADNVYAWAKEQAGEVSHEMFNQWLQRNILSSSTAAEALGISDQMVRYYQIAHKAIPRTIWLACLGWEATRPGENFLPLHSNKYF